MKPTPPPTPFSISRASAVAAAIFGAAVLAVAAPLFLVQDLPDPAPAAGAQYGMAVLGAGDLDADGTGDLAVGAPGRDLVRVFSGAGRTLLRDLADPDAVPAMKFGFALAAAGDLNGDLVSDLVVGAPGVAGLVPLPCVDPNTPCVPDPGQGRVFVFSGSDGSVLFKLLPPGTEFLQLGYALAAPGDVTGDGVPDVAAGAPLLVNGKRGQVYLFSGADGSVVWKAEEPALETIASFGMTLAAVADLNTDGIADLLVGAPFHDADPDPNITTLAGQAYVVSGKDGTILRTHDDPTPAGGETFGAGLSQGSDEDGDGVPEYLLGSLGTGPVVVVNGASGAYLREISSPAAPAADGFGYPIALLGDLDADGEADLAIGASQGGRVDLFRQDGTLIGSIDDPAPGAPATSGGFGWSLAATGDLSGDGLGDLLIGEPSESALLADAGAAWIASLNQPPVAICQSVVRNADAVCQAAVTPEEIDNGSYDPEGGDLAFSLEPPGPYGLGITPVVLTVTDPPGATDTCDATVEVVDVTPPEIVGATADRSLLWPPDHRMVDVHIDYTVVENCLAETGVTCSLAVASNEPDNSTGDGNTDFDTQVVDDHVVRVRAERKGNGSGRVYTIVLTCVDGAGNAAEPEVFTVKVPHDRGKPKAVKPKKNDPKKVGPGDSGPADDAPKGAGPADDGSKGQGPRDGNPSDDNPKGGHPKDGTPADDGSKGQGPKEKDKDTGKK